MNAITVVKKGDRHVALFRWSVETKDRVKAAGFRFDGAKKEWWTSDAAIAASLNGGPKPAPQNDYFATPEPAAADNVVQLIPAPDGLEYLPFQKEGITALLPRQHTLLADEPGLGKTIQAIGVINATPSIKRVLIICPASLKTNWKNELMRWCHRPMTIHVISPGADWQPCDIVILNYEQVAKYRDCIDRVAWDLLICDECFPAGTQVLTTAGFMAIDEIVNKRLPVLVASFNSLRNAVEWKPVIGFLRKKRDTSLVKITHENGSFICTANHPVWTKRGYVMATTLTCKDDLLTVPDVVLDCAARHKHCSILQSELCGDQYELQTICQTGNISRSGKTSCDQDLRMVQSNFQFSIEGETESAKAVLPELLCSVMAHDASWTDREIPSSNYLSAPWSIRNETARRFAAYETEQPNKKSSSVGKNKQGQKRDDFPGAWRKWTSDQTANYASLSDWVTYGSSGTDGKSEKSIQVFTDLLQSRSGSQENKNRNRNRRPQSPFKEMEILRSTQNIRVERSRVVSVEVLESGSERKPQGSSAKDQDVYCLEVKENHNFFADGVLVSNCHYLKNSKAARTQAVIGKWADAPADRVPPINATRKLWMTGTPILNRPKELWVAVRALDRNGLGRDWHAFHTRYCAAYKDVHGWQLDGNSNLDELQDRLRNGIMVRRKKADVLKELPAKRRQVFLLPAESADARKMLELEKELAPVKEKLDKLRAEVEALSVNQADLAYKKAVQALEKAEGVAFSDTARVRHQTALAKLPAAIDHLTNVLESESKVVVFAHHHDVIDGLVEGLTEYGVVKIDGRDSVDRRQAAVEAFQNPAWNTRVIVGSIGAMGVGLTLTAASYCGFVELDWVPGNMAQAEDRLHRIGQAESVLVQHIMLDGSFDGYMAATVVAKLRVIERATG
jgi:hypothetical protein